MIDWRIALVVWGGFSSWPSSLDSVPGFGVGWGLLPCGHLVVYQDWVITLLGLLLGGLVVYMHRANIKRLLSGTENKFSLRKKK